jgi:glycosyltransferase involved in cell wall biosynthesis
MSHATSVVIPYYNADHFLPQALASVQSQTVSVREVIVIDDGSDLPVQPPPKWDGPPLRIVRTVNKGPAAARNLGIEFATGEFVAFLDADDLWEPCKIAEQEKAMRADPLAIACFTRCARGTGLFGFGPYPPADVSENEFLLVLWYNNFFPPSAVMVRRDILKDVGGFDEDLRGPEDIELWIRLLGHGRFIQVPEPLCLYRLHPNQFTSDIYLKIQRSKEAYAKMISRYANRLIKPACAGTNCGTLIATRSYSFIIAGSLRLLAGFYGTIGGTIP